MDAVLSPQASRSHRVRASATALVARDELPWLAVVVLTAVGLRVLWVLYVNVDPNDGRFDDSVFYHNVARLLAQGAGYADPFGRGPTAAWPPAYPAALAVLYKLFGVHLLLAKGLNIALAAATVALTYVIARQIFDRRVAYVGGLILAFFPGQVYFSTVVFAQTAFAAVFMLVLLATLVWTVQRSEARWWQVLLLGFLVGAAAMVRTEGGFLAFVLLALWALTVRPWRRLARYGALLALGTVLALTPWTIRNAIQLQEFVVLRTNVTRIYSIALDPDAVSIRFGRTPRERTIGEGLRYQLTHPWEGLSYTGEKLHNFYGHDSDGILLVLNNRGRADEQPLTVAERARWRGLADRYYYAVGGAALVAAALCLLRRNRPSLVLIVAVLGWTLFFAVFAGMPRHHFPLGPVLSILAGSFVVFVWEWAGGSWGSFRRRGRSLVREAAARVGSLFTRRAQAPGS